MAYYFNETDFDDIMQERPKEDFGWASTVRLTLVGREVSPDSGMLLEEGRKRKWDNGKRMREEMEDKERRMPPKKIMAAAEMGNGGNSSSSSSHLSPGWQVNDLDIDLAGELSMNEALLSLPSLTVFKQEAPSPNGGVVQSPPRRPPLRRMHDRQMAEGMVIDGAERECIQDGMRQSPTNVNMGQHGGEVQYHSQIQTAIMQHNGYHSPQTPPENKGNGLLMCSPSGSLDGFLNSAMSQRPPELPIKDDYRFQYVLAAATSIATKTNEETLTYLNQGQPYEIKLKKLGDLSLFKGKILKSVIKICFHERRLQYMEREQMAAWHAERPGERIVDVDVPLSYGVVRVLQGQGAAHINCLDVLWDPTKDVGVYIKVNCISTEFTAKKHGGEKGVPFRVQVETYFAGADEHRLHAAACQIKVFKLKGADRKHKQDREKVMRKSRADLEKYQPSCEATVLSTLPNEVLLPPPSVISTSPSYSPELTVSAPKPVSSVAKQGLPQSALVPATNTKLYEPSEVKAISPPCHSPGAILPDVQQNGSEETDKNGGLSKEADACETKAWLTRNRFSQHLATFANFSGADLLRLSRDDIIQICGLADGIRLFNALHAKPIEPRLTVYVCAAGSSVYSALYLHSRRASELLAKLNALFGNEFECVLLSGPNGARVRLTDDVVRHMPDGPTFGADVIAADAALLLTPSRN